MVQKTCRRQLGVFVLLRRLVGNSYLYTKLNLRDGHAKGEQFIVLARLWSSDGKGPRSGGQQPKARATHTQMWL